VNADPEPDVNMNADPVPGLNRQKESFFPKTIKIKFIPSF
jgi:hypothetical protein